MIIELLSKTYFEAKIPLSTSISCQNAKHFCDVIVEEEERRRSPFRYTCDLASSSDDL